MTGNYVAASFVISNPFLDYPYSSHATEASHTVHLGISHGCRYRGCCSYPYEHAVINPGRFIALFMQDGTSRISKAKPITT